MFGKTKAHDDDKEYQSLHNKERFMNRTVFFILLCVTCSVSIFAQQSQIERITYVGPDERSRTINGVFLGYMQDKHIFVERTKMIEIYVSSNVIPENKWTDYSFSQRRPAPKGIQTLVDTYTTIL